MHAPLAINRIGYTDNIEELEKPYYSRLAFAHGLENEDYSQATEQDLPQLKSASELEPYAEQALVYTETWGPFLPNIALYGLRRSYNRLGDRFDAPFESAFHAQIPSGLERFDRTRVLYARPEIPSAAVSRHSTPNSRYACLAAIIDPAEVMVTDETIINDAYNYYRNFGYKLLSTLAERLEPLTEKYWQSLMPLSDYLTCNPSERPFRRAEILIPHDIPTHDIGLVD